MVNFYRCPLYLETTTSRSLSNSIYILSRINRVPSFLNCIHRWSTIGTYGNMMQLLRIIECPQRGYPIYRRARDDTEVAEDFYAILTVGTYGTLNGVDSLLPPVSSQLFADPT
jgi:hypothetical protein